MLESQQRRDPATVRNVQGCPLYVHGRKQGHARHPRLTAV
jgi:hypothetical protein